MAKFVYFGGSARRPELADELTDVAERFEEASPATAAHLRAALGEHAARDTKYINLRDGARTISVRSGDPATAVHHLDVSMRLASEQRTLPPAALERLAENAARAQAAIDDGKRRRSAGPDQGPGPQALTRTRRQDVGLNSINATACNTTARPTHDCRMSVPMADA